MGDISFERLSQRDSDNLSGARSAQRRLCDDLRYVPAAASCASVNKEREAWVRSIDIDLNQCTIRISSDQSSSPASMPQR